MTAFADRVYDIVRTIPRGETMTYAQVAAVAGAPGAHRAVGTILSKNHNPQVPCHRVIRSDGTPGGYNGGVERKRALLKAEGAL